MALKLAKLTLHNSLFHGLEQQQYVLPKIERHIPRESSMFSWCCEEASGAPRRVMGSVCVEHAAFRAGKTSTGGGGEGEGGRGKERKEEGSWGWGQLEVKLLGAAQNSPLYNGQEKWESVVGVVAVLVGEKETDWLWR